MSVCLLQINYINPKVGVLFQMKLLKSQLTFGNYHVYLHYCNVDIKVVYVYVLLELL